MESYGAEQDAHQIIKESAATQFFDLNMGPHDALFSLIPTRDLVQLSQTSSRIHARVNDVCFNITRLLCRFFGDSDGVAQFRQMQRSTGTLVSGSTALQFLNRLTWRDTDLDVYVTRGSAPAAACFIVDHGYSFQSRKSQNPYIDDQLDASASYRTPSYLGRGIADVLDFHKGDNKIQLIVASTDPMETIMSFHTTCVMNVITHDKALSLYPRSTFVTNEALVVETAGAGQEAGRQKYADRGWTLIHTMSASRNSELGVRVRRSVGDRFTWTISLPPLPADPLKKADFILSCEWELDCDGAKIFTAMIPHNRNGCSASWIASSTCLFFAIAAFIIVQLLR
ncbi:hypothetical protein MSAN_02040300 [Mycena sanguinolenta]|uniref:F-box domain-containing protein n=1 Tax=Mycena sanguinolenta TaxID=230812 RepID=A0A8H7CNK7_9AGAR|nr:hypothetical protein MSAN_02040300 [Mycena sanguinolenta]